MDREDTKAKLAKLIRSRHRSGVGLRGTEVRHALHEECGIEIRSPDRDTLEELLVEMVEAKTIQTLTRYGDYCWFVPYGAKVPEGAEPCELRIY